MKLVLDASVLVKWLIADPEQKPDLEQALAIMKGVQNGAIKLLQPPHWLAEVAAVLSRENAATVVDDVALLQAMELPVADSTNVYQRACELAVMLNHHLFDTLYHAIALEHADMTLISADQRYARKARHLGRITLLAEWQPI